MSGHEQETDIQESTPGSSGPDRAAGGMGVSSERVGPAGPGQHTTDGVRDVNTSGDVDADTDELPEVNPEGIEPKAGFPSKDPRSDDQPYEAPPA